MTIEITKCEYCSSIRKYLTQDNIGGKYYTNRKPSYKIGDVIVSYWNYDNYLTNKLH